jgi:hypothetical protein
MTANSTNYNNLSGPPVSAGWLNDSNNVTYNLLGDGSGTAPASRSAIIANLGITGGGTVISTSVVSANGFGGTVATPTTTPAITITTSVNGIAIGNGTGFSALTVGSGLSLVGTTLSATGSGSGNVNAGGTLTSNGVVIGQGTTAVAVVPGLTVDGTARYIAGVSTSQAGTVQLFGGTSGSSILTPPLVAGTNTVITLPNAASTLPIFGQQITFTGPTAARSIALPDAAFTVARTDAANTFTGASTGTSWTMTTPVIAGGLTASGAGTVDFSGSTAAFKTTTGAVTLGGGAVGVTGAMTITGPTATTALTLTQTARTSGVLPYIKYTIPADTAQTASTESPGIQGVTATRTWATTGTVALQREIFFPGPTYASAAASQTFTEAFNMYLTPPVAGTNAIFTRGHTLGIVDSTSASSAITGGVVVATTLGTAATSVGIGGGNIWVGGTFNGRTKPRVTTTNAPGATPTMNTDANDEYYFTGVATAITSMTTNLSGTPNEGDALIVRFKDAGTAEGITWGAKFVSSGNVTLPSTTVISTLLTVGFLWDSVASVWVITGYS